MFLFGSNRVLFLSLSLIKTIRIGKTLLTIRKIPPSKADFLQNKKSFNKKNKESHDYINDKRDKMQ